MRIELTLSVLAGFAGGLAGALWAGIVSSALLARRPELSAAGWRPDTAWRVLHTAALYGLCGAAAGLLFWLGWGLVAFTDRPWFVVGASFGLLLWFAAAFPALLLLSLRLPTLRAAGVVMAIEALVAAVSVGLLCAFVWHRGA
ncbi:MAG: hypothetical protein IPF84_03120 [Proteobacteria bacterium]|nr:hypothetical protein [Pseudomonadota bacterium]